MDEKERGEELQGNMTRGDHFTYRKEESGNELSLRMDLN